MTQSTPTAPPPIVDAPQAPAVPVTSRPLPSPAGVERARTRSRDFGTAWPWILALAGTLILLTSLFVRLPLARQPGIEPPATVPAIRAPSEAELASLRAARINAAARLVSSTDDLQVHLLQLEREAESKGLKVDFNVRPPEPVASGSTSVLARPVNAVVILPLSQRPSTDLYPALIAWLDATSRLPVRVEISRLEVTASGPGIRRASAELRFFERPTP